MNTRPRRLVLARHGQTPSNVIRRLDTLPPGPELSAEGHRQAGDLAGRLGLEPVAAVYASVATRARQTAAAVAAPHGMDVLVRDGLHEVQVGDLEGRHGPAAYQLFEDVFARWLAGRDEEPMPNGESARDVLDRFLPAVATITEAHTEGTVVVVSHGAAIRLAAVSLAGNLDRSAGAVYLPNCGTVTLDADPDTETGWRCVTWTGITQG